MDRWLKTGSVKRSTDESERNVGQEGESYCSTSIASSSCSNDLQKSAKRRKYCEEYLKLGFVQASDEHKPQCVLCYGYDILSNEAMKPAKLRRHLETKHPDFVGKPYELFKIKSQEMKKIKTSIEKMASGSSTEKATVASYEVALLIAKSGKPYTIAEELILPAAKSMCNIIIGEGAAKELSTVPLSNDTVKRRIDEMSQNIQEQLISKLKSTKMYALQLDESTDLTDKSHLLAFVRYENDNALFEELLFCKEILHNNAKDVFEALNNCILSNDLDWQRCVGLSTDGAGAMAGKKTGLIARVKAIAPNVKWTHCSIHREALAVKQMPENLKTTLNEVVKVVNYIKARPLNSRIFTELCEHMGSEHKQLFLHTEVRWLSRGNVLKRFFELRDEIRIFLLEDNHDKFQLKHKLCDFAWLSKVAYLADIFQHLNILNTKLQGPDTDIFVVEEKVEALIQKLKLWSDRMLKASYSSFTLLQEFLQTSEEELPSDVKELISEHLTGLTQAMRNYFPPPDPNIDWMKYPFKKRNIGDLIELSDTEQDQLAELSCSRSWEIVHQENNLARFWLLAQAELPELAKKALGHIVPFCTTYLCEKTFSELCNLKPKKRNRLKNIEVDLRLKLSKLKPNISEIVKSKKQHHPSH